MKVRHFGFLHASCMISADTLRRMILQVCPTPFTADSDRTPASAPRLVPYLWRTRCASSCAFGPPAWLLSIPAERDGFDRKRSVRQGL